MVGMLIANHTNTVDRNRILYHFSLKQHWLTPKNSTQLKWLAPTVWICQVHWNKRDSNNNRMHCFHMKHYWNKTNWNNVQTDWIIMHYFNTKRDWNKFHWKRVETIDSIHIASICFRCKSILWRLQYCREVYRSNVIYA